MMTPNSIRVSLFWAAAKARSLDELLLLSGHEYASTDENRRGGPSFG